MLRLQLLLSGTSVRPQRNSSCALRVTCHVDHYNKTRSITLCRHWQSLCIVFRARWICQGIHVCEFSYTYKSHTKVRFENSWAYIVQKHYSIQKRVLDNGHTWHQVFNQLVILFEIFQPVLSYHKMYENLMQIYTLNLQTTMCVRKPINCGM